MKYIITFFLLSLLHSPTYGQTATELYKSHNYPALAQLEARADKLTPDELYMVGVAYFHLENDAKAIDFYDKAIAKGLHNGRVHFSKGLSLKYLKRYDEALAEIATALQKEPTNQEFMNEKGVVFYSQSRYDEALTVFTQALNLTATFPEPYYWMARIYHEQNDFTKALAAYYNATKYLPKDNSNYLNSLTGIGKLEYSLTKNYKKSALAYSKAIAVDPGDYELYYKLIKSYNAGKDYSKADSVFAIVKMAFENGKLPKEDQEIKTIAIAQFEWNGQVAVIRKSLIDPKEMLDISYKVFLLDPTGKQVVRRFVVEQTLQLEKNGAKHLLCEQDKKTGSHITYPYGWAVDSIPLDDLQKAVMLVLDGKMGQSASSNFGRK